MSLFFDSEKGKIQSHRQINYFILVIRSSVAFSSILMESAFRSSAMQRHCDKFKIK